jgi:dsRNA-specific ribonuclease
MNSKFQDFIVRQLRSAGLNEDTIGKLTTSQNMKIWEVAFTHKSINIDANANYEGYETVGDAIINGVVLQYAFLKMGIINSGFLSKIKTFVVQGRGLANISQKLGFPEFIKFGQAIEDKLHEVPQEDWPKTEIYMGIIEDVLEAFTGVMMSIVDSTYGLEAGPGYAVVTKWWWTVLQSLQNEGTLAADYYRIWDPVTRLKEIYDKRKWNVGRALIERSDIVQIGTRTRPRFYATYYAWLKGDQTMISQNIVEVGSAAGSTKAEAKQTAALQALKTLEQYNIRDEPKDPFKRTQK